MRRLLLTILFFPTTGFGQELASGDSSILRLMQPKMNAIYKNKDTTLFFLTKHSFIDPKVSATNIVCYVKNSQLNRIVVTYTLDEGVLSKEFWLDSGKLIFCYVTQEYFDGFANKGKWKNFKNISAWESRYYFKDDKIVYEKHSGVKSPMTKKINNQLLAEKQKLLSYIRSRHQFIVSPG